MSTMRSGVTGSPAHAGVAAWRRIAVAAVVAVAVAGCSSSTITPVPPPTSTVAAATATPTVALTATPTLAATPTPTDTPTAAPSPSPTAAPKATPTPLPALAIGLCTGVQLKLTINDWESDNTGDPSYPHLTATNVSSATCNMRGTPRTQILDSHGNVIADSGNAGSEIKTSDPVYPLAPNGQIFTIVTWSNWCKAQPSQPYASAAVLPFGLGRVVAKPYTAKTTYPAGCYSSGTATTVSAEPWAP
ncbi:MAG: DUF4232 domain-containing protein [Candidatus Limnocylindrales bacterium]